MKLCIGLALLASADAYLVSPMVSKAPMLARTAARLNVAHVRMEEAAPAVTPEGGEHNLESNP